MNTEDSEFERLAMEKRMRALQKLHDENVRLGLYKGVYETSHIPLITDEEWAALNKEEE
jgi:hypothetical protein